MRGYLLDTNILRYWFDEKCPEHRRVLDRVSALEAGSPLRISAVSVGEVEYGHRCVSNQDTPVQISFKDFLRMRVPDILKIGANTSVYYGQLRKELFEKYSPKNDRKKLRSCQLVNPASATNLGIQENDLWIAAQAVEYNLVLVTHDAMDRICKAASDLVIEDWAV